MGMTPRSRAVVALIVAAAVAAVGLGLSWRTMRINRGIFHHLQHDHARAIQILSSVDLGPPRFEPVHHLVASHLRLGQRGEALAVLRGLIERHPDWPAAHLEMGVLLLRQGEWEEAWVQFAQAADLSGRSEELALGAEDLALARAVVALSQNRMRATLEEISPLRGRGGDYEDIVSLVEAMALFRLGLWERAREPLELCLERTPSNPRPAAMLALAHAAEGEWHTARLWFDRARSRDLQLANEIVIGTLRREIAFANTGGRGSEMLSGLSRNEALAWRADIWARGEQWDAVLDLLDSQPLPQLLTHHMIWHRWAQALEAVGDEEEAEVARRRRDNLDPDWNLSPDWPKDQALGRLGWRPRAGGEWESLNWREIPLPLGEDRPEGTAPFGLRGDQLNVFTDQQVDFPVDVATAGWYRLIFNLGGRVSGQIWPEVEISAPPVPPIKKYVDHYWPHFHVALLYLEPGVNTVRVRYVNDGEGLTPGEDRNLIIADVWVEQEPMIRGDQ